MKFTREKLYHNLAIMLNAGLPLIRALETSADAARGQMKRDLRGVHDALSEGEDLPAALEAHPRSFPPTDRLMLGVGHRSGRLVEACELLAHWHAFAQRIRRLLLSGLLLPALTYHAAALLIPLPQLFLGPLDLTGYGVQVVISLLFFYIPAGLVVAVIRWTPKDGPARRMLDRISMMIPVLGSGLFHLALTRFCRAFYMLYATGGLPLDDCVEMAARTAGSPIVADRLRGGVDSARNGQPVSHGFSRRLPRNFIETWSVGEESGSLDEAVDRLAKHSAEEAEHRFKQFASGLTKLVYVLVCLRIAVAIYQNARVVMGRMGGL